MNIKDIFEKYMKKLTKEAIIKSLLFGFFIGFIASIIAGVICYFVGFTKIWVMFVVLAVVTAIATLIVFFIKFKPSRKDVAKRLDKLGLEERLITMEEFKNDNSFIAVRQRADAESALKSFNQSLLRFVVPTSLIVLAAVFGSLYCDVVVVNALADAHIIKNGSEIIEDIVEEEPKFYSIKYEFDAEQGFIEGFIEQTIKEGTDGEFVMAIANDEYVFVSWSDGLKNPMRRETEVYEDATIQAVFEKVEDGDDGEPDDVKEADSAKDEPGESGDPGNSGDPSDDPGSGEGGSYQPNNGINNGSDQYGDFYGGAQSDAINQSQGLSGGEQGAIGDYFGGIATGGKN